jgi:hypothetical protein
MKIDESYSKQTPRTLFRVVLRLGDTALMRDWARRFTIKDLPM